MTPALSSPIVIPCNVSSCCLLLLSSPIVFSHCLLESSSHIIFSCHLVLIEFQLLTRQCGMLIVICKYICTNLYLPSLHNLLEIIGTIPELLSHCWLYHSFSFSLSLCQPLYNDNTYSIFILVTF